MRGPGVRRRYEDSGDDFELDMDQRTRSLGGRGRIILLGDRDNNEAGAADDDDHDDHDMIDDEDRDLDAQAGHDLSGSFEDEDRHVRREREGTPGPEAVKSDAASSMSGATARSEDSAATEDTVVPDEPEKAEKPEARAETLPASTMTPRTEGPKTSNHSASTG